MVEVPLPLKMLNKLAFSRKYLLLPYIDSLLFSTISQRKSCREPQSEDSFTDEKKRLITYYSKGRLEPVVFYKRMAELKRGTMTNACETSDEMQDSPAHTDTMHQGLIAKAKNLSSFLANWQIGNHVFSEEVFTRFIDRILIDSRDQITFCLKCGLALSEKIR